MKVNTRMGNKMVKEQKPTLMDKSMLGNLRMGNIMVKEHTVTLMEEKNWVNLEKVKIGMS